MSDVIPEISVIVAAHNAEATLGAQLEALARQQVEFPWEILICDNGSTDGTAELVRTWIEKLPQVVLVDASARRGPGAARNIGAGVAQASLIAFCDADDVVSDTWLSEMRNALRADVFVVGANDYVHLRSRRSLEVSRSLDLPITMPYWPQFTAAGAGNMGLAAAVFAEIGGFDELLATGEDVDLCWRIQLAGHPLIRCERAVVFIRKRRGLVAVYRQAYGYEVGNQLLRIKYATLIDDYWRQRVTATPDRAERVGIRTTLIRMLRRLRPNGLADTAWDLGEWIADRREPAKVRSK